MLHYLSLPSHSHTQMSRISSWSIAPTCLRTPESYERSSWVPRMQENQPSPTSCWAEKYAASLTPPTLSFLTSYCDFVDCSRGIWDLTWDFFVPGRCSLSPRRCTPLAAKLWGSSQRKRPRWWVLVMDVQQTGQGLKLRGSPLLLDLKKMMVRLTALREGAPLPFKPMQFSLYLPPLASSQKGLTASLLLPNLPDIHSCSLSPGSYLELKQGWWVKIGQEVGAGS